MELPVSFKEYAKDPVKAISFIAIMAIGYLYYDNKGVYKEQIDTLKGQVEKLEAKIEILENKIIDLTNRI